MFNGEVNATSGKFTGEVNATSGVFENSIIKENVKFFGNIYSGPLELTNEKPSADITKFNKGSEIKKLPFSDYYYGPIIGVYGSITFTYARKRWIDHHNELYSYYLYLYDEKLNLLYQEEGKDYLENLTLKYDMTIKTIITEDAKTFKLYNLPTATPSDTGTVWRDRDGYLRIV